MKNKTLIICLIGIFVLFSIFMSAEAEFIGKDRERSRASDTGSGPESDFLAADKESPVSKRRRSKQAEESDFEGSFFIESDTGSSIFPDDGFVETILGKWGKYERSSKKIWVQYDKDDLSAKSRMDFEKGYLTIETVVEAETPEEARALSKKLIARRIKRLYEDDEKSPVPVIENYLLDNRGGSLRRSSIEDFVDDSDFIIEVIERPSKRKERRERRRLPERRKAKKKYRTKSKIKMVPDHLHKRAKKVFSIVQSQCSNYDLEESLVLSVIHVESYFNPRAVSHAGAVGLMQLMPQYGGAEAYKKLYGKKWNPSKHYLINPRNNIKLGCTYLNMLHDEYFRNIRDSFKKRYASVAGYNWGPGSVRKKVINRKNIARMGREEFFNYLHSRLPKETKNYIVRVRENEGNYSKILSKNKGFK